MEENTQLQQAIEHAPEPAPTTDVTTAPIPRTKMPIILLGTVAVLTLIAAAILLLNRPGNVINTLPAGTGFNVQDPQTATVKLNEVFPEFIDAAFSGNSTDSLDSLGAESVEAMLLNVSVQSVSNGQSVDAAVSGKLAVSDANFGQFEGNVTVKTAVEGFGDIDATIDLAVPNSESLYFKLSGLPSQTAALLTQIGLNQGPWYRLPYSSLAGNTASITENFGTKANAGKFQTLKDQLNGEPLFVNPVSKPDRTVFGYILNCMSVELNPALGEKAAQINALEICNNDTLLPIYIGIVSNEGSVPTVMSVELAQTNPLTVDVPENAQDAVFLINLFDGFLGGSGSSLVNKQPLLGNPDNIDDTEVLEYYQELYGY